MTKYEQEAREWAISTPEVCFLLASILEDYATALTSMPRGEAIGYASVGLERWINKRDKAIDQRVREECAKWIENRLSKFVADAFRKGEPQELCPKCGTGVVQSNGHGTYCPNERCKWGWEIDREPKL